VHPKLNKQWLLMDNQEKQLCRNRAQAKIHEQQKETDNTQVKKKRQRSQL
jgi:hypothetical protein